MDSAVTESGGDNRKGSGSRKSKSRRTRDSSSQYECSNNCNVNEPWVEAANEPTGNNAGSEDKDSKSDYDPLKNLRCNGIPAQVMHRALVSLVPLFICLFLLPYMHSYPTPGQIEGIAKWTWNPFSYFGKVGTAGSKFNSLTTRTEALLKKLQAVKSSTKNWESLLETIDKDVASIGEVVNSTDTVEEVMDLLNLFQIINTANNLEANIEMLQQSLVGMHEALALAKSVATEAYTKKQSSMYKNMGVPEPQLDTEQLEKSGKVENSTSTEQILEQESPKKEDKETPGMPKKSTPTGA